MADRGMWQNKKLILSRWQLEHDIPIQLCEGWEVAYVIPVPVPGTIPSWFIQTDGSLQITQGGTTSGVNDVFEIGLVKFADSEPCPTCSHLNPDRMDREA